MEAPTLVRRSRWAFRCLLVVALVGVLGSGTLAPGDGVTALADGAHLAQVPTALGDAAVVIHDVPYGERDGVTLRLDVYRSTNAYDDPALVLVHGGSWRRRSKATWSSLAPQYAEAGYVVFAIEYRLAPPGGKTRFPAPVDDVVTAIEWAREHASVYGGDPDRVAVAGSSAGGHLALLAAGSDRARPDAVALFSAPIKLKGLHRADILRGSIENFIGCPPEACAPVYWRASGLGAVDEATPPILVAFSSDELIPRHQPMELVRRLLDSRRHFVQLELRGTRHGMAVAKRTVDETVHFLDLHL